MFRDASRKQIQGTDWIRDERQGRSGRQRMLSDFCGCQVVSSTVYRGETKGQTSADFSEATTRLCRV